MKKVFEARGTFDCSLFEYDYNRPLKANGVRLAEFLAPLTDDIVIVGHSMGGLVARLAVLTGKVPNVKRVIMLGTPNFGAMRTAGAGLLAQLALQATGRVTALFRRPGILELTRIPKIMKDEVVEGEPHARQVEYVTIPALFFNESRGSLEFGEWSGTPTSTKLFATLGIGMELLSPNRQGAPDAAAARRHRQRKQIKPDDAGTDPRRTAVRCQTVGIPCAHITHRRCDDLNHVNFRGSGDHRTDGRPGGGEVDCRLVERTPARTASLRLNVAAAARALACPSLIRRQAAAGRSADSSTGSSSRLGTSYCRSSAMRAPCSLRRQDGRSTRSVSFLDKG
jgi:pimeloyl-ACP methyl ester carboxylesterase